MLKQFFYMVVLTALAVIFAKEFVIGLHALGNIQFWLAHQIYSFFPRAHLTRLIINIGTLVIIPFLIGFIPAFIYWLVERKELSRLMVVVWIAWIVLLLVFVLYK